MTNFENKKDECMKILTNKMALVDGKPVLCEGTNCYNCDFFEIENGCDEQAMEWLLSEYQEPTPKLTKREKEFLECFTHITYKEIFRTDYGLYISSGNREYALSIASTGFLFIKPGETWTFEDLLKLEVEE